MHIASPARILGTVVAAELARQDVLGFRLPEAECLDRSRQAARNTYAYHVRELAELLAPRADRVQHPDRLILDDPQTDRQSSIEDGTLRTFILLCSAFAPRLAAPYTDDRGPDFEMKTRAWAARDIGHSIRDLFPQFTESTALGHTLGELVNLDLLSRWRFRRTTACSYLPTLKGLAIYGLLGELPKERADKEFGVFNQLAQTEAEYHDALVIFAEHLLNSHPETTHEEQRRHQPWLRLGQLAHALPPGALNPTLAELGEDGIATLIRVCYQSALDLTQGKNDGWVIHSHYYGFGLNGRSEGKIHSLLETSGLVEVTTRGGWGDRWSRPTVSCMDSVLMLIRNLGPLYGSRSGLEAFGGRTSSIDYSI